MPASNSSKSNRNNRPKSVTPVWRSKGESPLFVMMAILIGGICLFSLWVAVMGLLEKQRLMKAFEQINNILTITRQQAPNEHKITDGNQMDLLAILNGLSLLKPTGESYGWSALNNPWGGKLIAKTEPGNRIRIETTIPNNACRRMLAMYGQKHTVSDLQALEVRTDETQWMQAYIAPQEYIHEAAINNFCGFGEINILALTFPIK